jgi:far upstream element-binding protein
MVEDLLHQAEAAPLQQSNDDPSSIAENAADAHDSSNGTPGYTPAPVAALIHGTTFAGNHYGNYGEMLEEQIGVPNGVVGFIIGRGGENITSMQARSGCKIQIQKENEMTPGQTQRVITLTATTKESIDSCRGMIEAMVQDRIRTTNSSVSMASAMSTPGGGGTQAAKLQEAIVAGHQLVTVIVPDGDVGLIIGRSGTTIRDIQDRSGANIQIPQQGDADNPTVRTVSITHPHLEGAQAAKQMIEQLLASKSQQSSFAPHTSLQVMVRDMFMGFFVFCERGKGHGAHPLFFFRFQTKMWECALADRVASFVKCKTKPTPRFKSHHRRFLGKSIALPPSVVRRTDAIKSSK